VTGWLTRHPDRLTEDEHLGLKAILMRCPELQAAADHVRAFGEMLSHLRGQQLPAWIAAVRADADDLLGLGSFAAGLERDLDALTRGLTTRWSSGPIEGRVTTSKWCRVAGGIAAPGSHGTVRNDLSLYGSCCPGHQTTGTVGTQTQWAKNRGLVLTVLVQASCAFLRPRNRLYFLRSQRIR
jgi:hypothetical protein